MAEKKCQLIKKYCFCLSYISSLSLSLWFLFIKKKHCNRKKLILGAFGLLLDKVVTQGCHGQEKTMIFQGQGQGIL